MIAKTRDKANRAFYPVGLISLILFPILCYGYLTYKGCFNDYTTVDVLYWTPKLHEDFPNLYSAESHPSIEYQELVLTGDESNDKLVLENARTRIRSIIASNDTAVGLHLHFSDEAKLWSLISTLDICKQEKVKTFTVWQSEIWIFNKSIQKNSAIEDAIDFSKDNALVCGNDNFYLEPSISWYENITNTIDSNAINILFAVASISLYIILIVFNIQLLRKTLNN